MNFETEQIIRNTLADSEAERVHFGEVVARLSAAGVESYSVDYRNNRFTYFLGDDESLTLETQASDVAIGNAFSAAEIQAAIRQAQQGVVKYPEFKKLSKQAGCIGYTVWIAGRHVTYFGRKGEQHIEHFPI
ncbi:MAG TPA: DUF1398 family protein [Cellvibrio sp.]|nr:DUF1398 family protein [Cellvibrio sp.]